MRYQTFQPAPRLAQYVECFWTLESRRQPADTAPENILPDGCVELIFNLADPFQRYQAHFIHDFKEFSRQNPSAYFNQDYEMSAYFTRKNRMSDFYNTMAP